MIRTFTQSFAYVVISLAVFLMWTVLAKTEKRTSNGQIVRCSGPSLVQAVEGTNPSPFVKRRLLPDVAWGLSRLVPLSAWDALTRTLRTRGWWQGRLGHFLESVLYWNPEHYPLLFSGYFLIWLSTLGFMYQCKALTKSLYAVSDSAAAVVGALFGIAILGSNGIWSDYPYDIPNAFVFCLALNALIGSGRWWLPLFAIAAYSKETAILLVMAYALLERERWREFGFWTSLALQVAIFVIVRTSIELRFAQNPSDANWYPSRNLFVLTKSMVQYMWVWWIVLFAILRMIRMVAGELPRRLGRLIPLILVLIGFAFFKGWIDERRGYLEVLPIAGLIVCQWSLSEVGCGHLMRPRDRAQEVADDPASPAVGQYEVNPTVAHSPSEFGAVLGPRLQRL